MISMDEFEYHFEMATIWNNPDRRVRYFDDMGRGGWEYCGMDSYGYFIFKRKVVK